MPGRTQPVLRLLPLASSFLFSYSCTFKLRTNSGTKGSKLLLTFNTHRPHKTMSDNKLSAFHINPQTY